MVKLCQSLSRQAIKIAFEGGLTFWDVVFPGGTIALRDVADFAFQFAKNAFLSQPLQVVGRANARRLKMLPSFRANCPLFDRDRCWILQKLMDCRSELFHF
jgi:hypothetical protein